MSTSSPAILPIADATPVDADTRAVIDKLIAGVPLDAATYRRIRERAERATAELRRQRGELNVAVDLVRESRGAGCETLSIPRSR